MDQPAASFPVTPAAASPEVRPAGSPSPPPVADQAPERATPFAIIGGDAAIGGIVDRFYDLMERDPAYAALRAMHQPELAPMRRSLKGFLAAWTGGPRDWFADARPGGSCLFSLHAAMAIDAAVAAQWAEAMTRAIDGQAGIDARIDAGIAALMKARLVAMTGAMVNRGLG